MKQANSVLITGASGNLGAKLHPEKTRLIEFGRFAAERRTQRGQGKPETFHFLGFTHLCGKTRKGAFTKILHPYPNQRFAVTHPR